MHQKKNKQLSGKVLKGCHGSDKDDLGDDDIADSVDDWAPSNLIVSQNIGAASQGLSSDKKQILVVESDLFDNLALQMQIKSFELSCDYAVSGQTAL